MNRVKTTSGTSLKTASSRFLWKFTKEEAGGKRVPPVRAPDLHRPLRTTTPWLKDILCRREQRYVGAQLTFHYDRKQIHPGADRDREGLRRPVRRTLRLLGQASGGSLARAHPSLSRLQQGPACQPRGHRREQAPRPCALRWWRRNKTFDWQPRS
jgi:hypothetical protein